jgi:hypothetical protein
MRTAKRVSPHHQQAPEIVLANAYAEMRSLPRESLSSLPRHACRGRSMFGHCWRYTDARRFDVACVYCYIYVYLPAGTQVHVAAEKGGGNQAISLVCSLNGHRVSTSRHASMYVCMFAFIKTLKTQPVLNLL